VEKIPPQDLTGGGAAKQGEKPGAPAAQGKPPAPAGQPAPPGSSPPAPAQGAPAKP
jgi:hypothetical protein